MKKSLCLLLSLCMLFAISQSASATGFESSTKAACYSANIAFVADVNETGTKIIGDKSENIDARGSEELITVEQKSNNSIEVTAILDNERITIAGIPAGRTESGKTIFFTPTTSNARYEVVNFAYVTDTSVTNMYFKNAKATKHPEASSMLKIYVKDTASDTLDYYFIESFDVELYYQSEYIFALPINHLLGAWTVTQFQPIGSEFGQDTNASSQRSNSKTWYCTKSFYDIGEYTTHTISWRTTADCINVRTGGDANQSYFLTIYAKSMSFEINTDLNSSTSSYLHIDSVRLCQSSIPNTAWKSIKIDGSVHNNSIFAGDLSASIGFSWGPIGISYSIPLYFTYETTIDIDETYDSFENNVNGQYVRSIETEMDSSHRLTQIGHYFSVDAVLRDYVGVTQSAKTLSATWYVDVINFATMEIYPQTCPHNSSVSIIN